MKSLFIAAFAALTMMSAAFAQPVAVTTSKPGGTTTVVVTTPSPATTQVATATATSASAAAASSSSVTLDPAMVKVGGLSLSVGNADGTLVLPNGIPVTVGPGKVASSSSSGSSSKARASASTTAKASAKSGPPENGRLVVMKCDNSFTVTLVEEYGTQVHEARNCAPPFVRPVSAGIRIIEAPASQVVTVAAAAASASATTSPQAPAAVPMGPVATTESIWLWHPPKASDANPQGCIIASGNGLGLPPRCSSARPEAALPGESKSAWLVRVGGGIKPTDTGIYTYSK